MVQSAGRAWVDQVPARTFFSLRDLPGSPRAAESLLSRLATDDGPVQRVKPGLYWKKPPLTRFGTGSPDPAEAALIAAGPGSGPAGWSASNVLGLSTQVPPVPTVAVVGRAPKGVAGVRFTTRSNLRRIGLTPLEIAVLEVLRDPTFTELTWADVVTRLRELGRSGRIDFGRLGLAANGERRPGLRARLSELVAL